MPTVFRPLPWGLGHESPLIISSFYAKERINHAASDLHLSTNPRLENSHNQGFSQQGVWGSVGQPQTLCQNPFKIKNQITQLLWVYLKIIWISLIS